MSETSKFDLLKYSQNIKPDYVFVGTSDTDDFGLEGAKMVVTT